MKYILFILIALTSSHLCAEPVFRESYVVNLTLEDGKIFKEEIKEIPYVADEVVYIFPGESFSVGVETEGNEIKDIYYDKEKKSKFGLDFKFTQEDAGDGKKMMMLKVVSRLPKTLSYEALMVMTDSDEVKKTSVLPIEAGLAAFESWPDPIMQLALRKFKFEEKK